MTTEDTCHHSCQLYINQQSVLFHQQKQFLASLWNCTFKNHTLIQILCLVIHCNHFSGILTITKKGNLFSLAKGCHTKSLAQDEMMPDRIQRMCDIMRSAVGMRFVFSDVEGPYPCCTGRMCGTLVICRWNTFFCHLLMLADDILHCGTDRICSTFGTAAWAPPKWCCHNEMLAI